MVHQIQAEIRALLREEECEILKLEDAGHDVLRRRDADVGVLLTVWREMDSPPASDRKPADESAPGPESGKKRSSLTEIGRALNADAGRATESRRSSGLEEEDEASPRAGK